MGSDRSLEEHEGAHLRQVIDNLKQSIEERKRDEASRPDKPSDPNSPHAKSDDAGRTSDSQFNQFGYIQQYERKINELQTSSKQQK